MGCTFRHHRRELDTLSLYTSDLQEMRRDIAQQFTERPWYTSGSTLQVSRLTAPRVVLLGDAAHAVSAAFGQGVNSALEVWTVLSAVYKYGRSGADAF